MNKGCNGVGDKLLALAPRQGIIKVAPLRMRLFSVRMRELARFCILRLILSLGYVSWKGVPVPEQRHEYPVGVTGTVTGFGVESFFPARRGIFDTQFCKRIWKRTVHLPQ